MLKKKREKCDVPWRDAATLTERKRKRQRVGSTQPQTWLMFDLSRAAGFSTAGNKISTLSICSHLQVRPHLLPLCSGSGLVAAWMLSVSFSANVATCCCCSFQHFILISSVLCFVIYCFYCIKTFN